MLKTNEDKLVKISVVGQITHPLVGPSPYRISVDGEPLVLPGTGGITYGIRIGDNCIDLVADHVEPGVSISNFSNDANRQDAINGALNLLTCVGNKAKVIEGDAEGETGTVTGKHGGIEHVLVDFEEDVKEKLKVGDKMQIKAHGVGLKLLDHLSVKLMNMSPKLLEAMDIKEENGKLNVAVTHTIPASVMGSGVGKNHCYRGDYDIQMFDEETVKAHKMESMRFGDIVAVTDADHSFGRTYRKGAVTIGVVVHSCCSTSGHGPGVTSLMTCRDGEIETHFHDKANLALLLSLRKDIN